MKEERATMTHATNEGVRSNLRDAVALIHSVPAVQNGAVAHEPGRWTTLVELEMGGFHYRLVREGQRKLTPRERDVVEQVLRGLTNKEIAYDLGIAHATVRVLLHRVMVKMGVQSRGDLLKRLLGSPDANESDHAPTVPLLTDQLATAQEI